VGNRSMCSYSWDLVENSVASTIAEFKKIRINTVTMSCSYHAGRYGAIKPSINAVYETEDVLRELPQIPDLEVNVQNAFGAHYYMSGAEKVVAAAKSLRIAIAKNINYYLDYRSSVVTSLVSDIRKSVREDIEVEVISSVARPTGGTWYEGT
jgi:hypothetical protein